MQNRLEQETFAVSQIPVDRYPFAVASHSPLAQQDRDARLKQVGISAGGVQTTRDITSPVKKHSERITSFAIGFQPPTSSESVVECLFFVDNLEDILTGLENDIITVKILLASPHLGSLRGRAESLMKTLIQLKELMGLLSHTQDKVSVYYYITPLCHVSHII